MPDNENEIVLEESEIQSLFQRLAELRCEVGSIPEAFLEPLEDEGESLFVDPLFEGVEDPSPVGERDELLHGFEPSDDETEEETKVEPTAVPFAGCFDPNRYFDVFDLLRLESGHRFDYVYEFLGNSGQPLLYTRKDDRRIQSPHEYAEHFPDWESRPPYLEGVSFDNSPLGFFQFALFCVEAPKFYLYWHSGYYDLELVCTRAHLNGILQEIARTEAVNTSDRRLLENELRPRVRMDGDSAEVKALSFTKWGGFFTHRSRITWPNRLHDTQGEKLVAYDCGILF
jgi:hypothetical protein